jgi:hypothetical protein
MTARDFDPKSGATQKGATQRRRAIAPDQKCLFCPSPSATEGLRRTLSLALDLGQKRRK